MSVLSVLVVGGCGDDDESSESDAVRTDSPARTFAPLVEVAADEPWRPMSARWFIERSAFWFAEDRGCRDRKIAVGHALPEQQDPDIDWIFPKGLGGWSWPAYYRNPLESDCELDFDVRMHAHELTRPYDPGPRAAAARPAQGYYLDLEDEARSGPPLAAGAKTISQPVYVTRSDEGDHGVRLTYWMLFGMRGEQGAPNAREGDWRRVDVLLRDEGDDRYLPVAVQLDRDVDWGDVRRDGGTHPVVVLERATHRPVAARGAGGCPGCLRWEAWRSLAAGSKEPWFGFGGAWGEPGTSDATTGSLGPHDRFPSSAEALRDSTELSKTVSG